MIRTVLGVFAILAGACPTAAGAQQSAEMTLDVCPNNFNDFPMDIAGLRCTCSADQAKADDTIWGGNPYMATSSICRAAAHAGAISTAGGEVKVTPAPGVAVFPSITRNGIESASSGAGDGFAVAGAGSASAAATAAAGTTAAGTTLDVCPNNYDSFPMDSPPLTCACSAEQAKADETIWGANPYMTTSSICRAAVHAGAISTAGGEVKVRPSGAVAVFPSVTRNGVASASTSRREGFAVEAVAGATSVAPLAANAAGMTLDVCPNDYDSFPMDSPPLTCPCSAEQAKADETIWGTNPYMTTSSICRAAVHSGAISTAGGEVKVTPAGEVAVFPSVTKNGVESASTSHREGFLIEVTKKAEAAKPAVDAAGKPVQAPIAETLKATGRVQLYINFATDKAEPLPTSAPVLAELLTTLRDDTALKLDLIGHTDSQGGADYNLDLSQRRAASVYLFLVQSGIQPERLRASGRGLMEPIADNETVEGRALNRRVEARQMQ